MHGESGAAALSDTTPARWHPLIVGLTGCSPALLGLYVRRGAWNICHRPNSAARRISSKRDRMPNLR